MTTQPPGRKRTINHRPSENGQSAPISLDFGPLLNALGVDSIELGQFSGRLIIRLEVIQIELEIKTGEAPDLREETDTDEQEAPGEN